VNDPQAATGTAATLSSRGAAGLGRPTSVRLRAYRVGFGDCLLLTVTYPERGADAQERHVLIDLGTKESDDHGPELSQVADLVARHSGGHLAGLLATHRHQDHISGFGTQAIAATIDGLQPELVIRPWTDVPDAQTPSRRLMDLDPRSLAFLGVLEGMHRTAEEITKFSFGSVTMAKRAQELASLGFKNVAAIAALEDWGRRGRDEYVKAGDRVDVEQLLPGVTVEVLGPPTLAQVPRLTSYAKTSEEYWLALADQDSWLALQSQPPDARQRARETLASPAGAGAAEWLLRALWDARTQLDQALELVEAFDDVLNNTSVIVLVTVGTRTLLLPGDAQAENWSFTLDQALGRNGEKAQPALRRRLAEVDLYKVGHHGSLNATPVSLFQLWEGRSPSNRPLTSVLTTKKNVYDKSKEGAVPKRRLVDALQRVGPLHSTDGLAQDVWWFDLVAPAYGDHPFVFTPGPAQAMPPRPRAPRRPDPSPATGGRGGAA